MGKTFTCLECKSSYYYYKNLRKHVRKAHPDKISDIAPTLKDKKTFKYKCEYCERQFNHLYNYRYHERKVHNFENGAVFNGHKFKKLKCPMCDETYSLKRKLFNHIEEAHKISVHTENLKFESYTDFMHWKQNIEKDTLSRYIKEHGSKRDIFNSIKHYFVCHRSGRYIPEGKGQRKLKSQGSQKINGTCPASLQVQEKEDGSCLIKYIPTHVGHYIEVDHLCLTPSERNNLAMEIANKTPFEIILERAHNSTESKLSRVNILKKKDLYNIKNRFRLRSSIRRLNKKLTLEKVCIDYLLSEMTGDKSQCILFHKPPESLNDNYPVLKLDDFLLILMNEQQCNLLKNNGSKFLCVDRTDELNRYGFELMTVFVIDNINRACPCAFLITNRWDQHVMKIFFESIKLRVGTISCRLFMSDRESYISDAWISVMNKPSALLYCSWHVQKEWKKNLSRIKVLDKRNAVYTTIKSLMEESQNSEFYYRFSVFVEDLVNDPVTNDFGNYLNECFSKNFGCWAFCYRSDNINNMNSHFERLHRTINYHFLHGKNSKQFHKSLSALVSFIDDKFFNEITGKNDDNKLVSVLNEIKNKHKCSLKLITDLVIEEDNGWKVQSTADVKDVHYVKKNVLSCDPNCLLVCKECNICTHQYICSCLDSDIKWNMCKHVHLICHFLKLQPVNNDSISVVDSNSEMDSCNIIDSQEITEISGNTFTIPIESEVVISESGEILLQFGDDCGEVNEIFSNSNGFIECESNCDVSLDGEKQNLKQEIISLIDNLKTADELELVKQNISALKELLAEVQMQTVCISTTGEQVSSSAVEEEPQIETVEGVESIIANNNVYSVKKIKTSQGAIIMNLI